MQRKKAKSNTGKQHSPPILIPPLKPLHKSKKLDEKKFCTDISRGLTIAEASAKQKLNRVTGYRYLKKTGVKIDALRDYKQNRLSYADVDVLLMDSYLKDVLLTKPNLSTLASVEPLAHSKITKFIADSLVSVDKIARLEAGKPTEGISLRDARDRLVDMMTEAQGRLEELEVGSVVVEVAPVKEDIEPK